MLPVKRGKARKIQRGVLRCSLMVLTAVGVFGVFTGLWGALMSKPGHGMFTLDTQAAAEASGVFMGIVAVGLVLLVLAFFLAWKLDPDDR